MCFGIRKSLFISDGIQRGRFQITDITHKIGESPKITGYITDHEGYRAGLHFLDELHSRYAYGKPLIERVIFNDPATIVIWKDGSKTVVKCQPGDEYSKETGLAMCIAKKYLGNKGNFNETFKKYIEDYDSPLVDGIPKVGTRIKIIDAGMDAHGADGLTGRVTTKEHTAGLLSSDEGYNVDTGYCVWRISKNAEIKILRG